MSLVVFVCLSVCQHEYSKTRAWIWMKCCMSTDVRTWTNWLTFEPDPDHSPDAATKLLFPISYRLRNFAALPRLPASCAATRNFTWENPTYTYWRRAARASRDFKMFFLLSRRKTFVGGKCALPSALLVKNITRVRTSGCCCALHVLSSTTVQCSDPAVASLFVVWVRYR